MGYTQAKLPRRHVYSVDFGSAKTRCLSVRTRITSKKRQFSHDEEEITCGAYGSGVALGQAKRRATNRYAGGPLLPQERQPGKNSHESIKWGYPQITQKAMDDGGLIFVQ